MVPLELSKGSGLHKVTGSLECGGRGRKPQRPHAPQCHARLTGPPESTSSQAPSLSLCVFHCLSLTLFICFPLFLMFLSACLFVCLCLFLSLIRRLAGGRVPAQGGGGRGRLGLGQPWTLVLALITAGFLRGQDWVMVSLLPPQSDVTLPGPSRLEGEPQGDFMQAPGPPGSPAPQNVSTWHLGLG